MAKQLKKLINEYKTSVYNLAVEMAKIRKIDGRKALENSTLFDLTRINTLCGIGDICRGTDNELLPEHMAELINFEEEDIQRYVKVIIENKYKPSQLRKYIREDRKEINNEDNKVSINSWARNILLLENDIKSMSSKEKQRALAHITNTLLNL